MMKDKTTWLVIASAVKADIYAVQEKKYTLITTLTHPESRLKSAEIAGDKPGSYSTDHTARGHFSASSSTPHEEEHKIFAREIAAALEQGRQTHQYHALILCAEPHFHGLLNQAVTHAVSLLITQAIEKDYIGLPKDKVHTVIEGLIHAEK